MKYPNNELIKMYRTMLLSRLYCNSIDKCVLEGKIIGMHHLSQGEEAVSVGVRAAMKEDDWFTGTHRTQAAYLWNLDIKKLCAEEFSKVTGYCQGIGLDSHLSSKKDHVIDHSGILGQNFPVGVGVAHALKRAGKGQVMVACQGDGGLSEGVIYEAMIHAATLEEPVVLVMIDNGYGISYSSRKYKNMIGRAEAFGLIGFTADGQDVLDVRDKAEKAIALARQGFPTALYCKTLRWGGHYSPAAPQEAYRDLAEVEESKTYHDPIKKFAKQLLAEGVMDQEQMDSLEKELQALVDEAISEGIAADYPDASVAIDPKKLYVDPCWEV